MHKIRTWNNPRILRHKPSYRTLSHFRVTNHVIPASHVRTYPDAIKDDSSGLLKLALKQYVPIRNHDNNPHSDAVTIIGGHANGFPKELYEPLWDDLFEDLDSRGKQIRSIWIADIVNQGQSGIINEAFLGDDPNWWDHARDLLSAINQKQSMMPQPLVGIGHSMGASILAAVAMLHPSLFQSLVLIEPVIQTEIAGKAFAAPSTHRRDRWPSKDAAIEAFSASQFYQSWDKRVLSKWLDFGLMPDQSFCLLDQTSTTDSKICEEAALHDHLDELEISYKTLLNNKQPVELTTSKAQEVYHYVRPLYKATNTSLQLKQYIYPDINEADLEIGYDFYRPEPAELYRRLPELRPSALYLFGKSSPVSTPELRKQKMDTTGTGIGGSGGTRTGRVKETVFETGHMLPFEDPSECAGVAGEWICDEVGRWQSLRDEWRVLRSQKQDATKKRDRHAVDEEWLKRMPKPVRPKKINSQ